MLLPLHLIPPGLCPGEKSQKLGFQFNPEILLEDLLQGQFPSCVWGAGMRGDSHKDVRSDLGPVLRWSCPTLLVRGGCIYHQLTFDLVYTAVQT